MLWNVSGDNTYRMNGGVPGVKQTILLNAITIGAHYGMQYQEIYLVDLEDSTLSSVITTANTLLTVTPPPPAAPSNLSGTANGAYVPKPYLAVTMPVTNWVTESSPRLERLELMKY